MAPDPVKLGEEVVGMCRGLGFALAGIADAAPTRWGRELRAWLDAGKGGEMAYLSEQVAARLDPNLVLRGARAAIMVGDLYASRADPAEDPEPPGAGRVARYARGRDYHWRIKKRLHALSDELRARYPGSQFRTFVDTAPVMEREFAARAGLGWIGKHTLLIHPRLGSYTLLGGVLTTMHVAPPPDQEGFADHCGACTRCIDACPTGAITPHSVDATRCISYLTIERRGNIEPELHAAMGRWVYGCDICQEVCPHNSARPETAAVGEANPDYAPRRRTLDLFGVLGWGQADRRREFEGTSMKRATLAMMKRNALIVAGNVLDGGGAGGGGEAGPALLQRVKEVAADAREPEMVRQTAAAVLRRLGG